MYCNKLCFGYLILWLSSTCTDSFALPFEGLYRLDIVHYNDFHARFEETSVATPTCRFNNNSCLGGFPRLYHEVMTLMAEKPDALLLNAGDSFQGTYWYTLLKWNVTQQFMNLLPHDAHAIGNHEFDDGPEGLAPYLASLKAPVLAANMDTTLEPTLTDLYQPSVVVERKGRKIGIIGLITNTTKTLSSPGNVEFTDVFEATKREAIKLSESGVDIIILLSHCGLDVDIELARQAGEYIDVIVGGHTHSLLWDGAAPSGEAVAGPYPMFVQSSNNLKHEVLIVQASAFTKYMGNLSVYFDFRGDYVKWDGGPIYLNRSIPEDSEIKAQLAPYAAVVQQAEREPVGESLTNLNADDCVFGECAIGDLLVDGMKRYGMANVNSSYPHLSFMQRGNIKSSILKGTIRKVDLFEILPYNDRVKSFELRGDFVRAALERSVSEAWATQPFKGPWVLQVSGIEVVYNISLPEGGRVTSALVGRAALDDAAYYRLTLPAFLADGGDGFTMFNNKVNVSILKYRDQGILEDFVKRNSPIDVKVDGRIKVTY